MSSSSDASVPANAKHFQLGEVDFTLIEDFRQLRMRPILEATKEMEDV